VSFSDLKPGPAPSPGPARSSGKSAPRKPSVMLLCTALARAGAETQVALLARRLHERGWSVCVVSMLPPSAFQEELESFGIPVQSLRMRPGRPSLRAMGRLLVLLWWTRPAILHAHLFHANMLARCIRLLCPLPVVISTIHSLADRLCEATVCVSKAVANRHIQARAIAAQRTHVIHNAADGAMLMPDPDRRTLVRESLGLGESFTWLAAGRLIWKKDYLTLLAAIARLARQTRSFELLVAGDGPLARDLRRHAEEQGLPVRFLGLHDDVSDLMKAADAMVLSSVVEGLPVALVEAALHALPSVATRVGGVEEVVIDAHTGLLVPPGDPDALAAAMERVMSLSPAERQKLGAAARVHALHQFSPDEITAQWEGLYASTLLRVAGQIAHGP